MNTEPEEMTNPNVIKLDGPDPPLQSETSRTRHSDGNSLGSLSLCSETDQIGTREAKIETCQEKSEEKKEETKVKGFSQFLSMNTDTEEMTEQNANPRAQSEAFESHQSSVNLLGSQIILSSETDQLPTQEANIGTFQERKEENKEETERLSSETTSDNQADNGRERLKRHRREVAGRVWIPEIWGQEDLLKDWSDCSVFDACLVPNGISRARAALVDEAKRASSGRLRVENRC